ncbi:prepilin-type N-terminal cleavage/methylation domain-containing protein [Microcoleus sp. FACHB-68]|uniref:prepilin-type N-terminal cleavage/methylation domain-containing protein n=1 Tax=Microcoleus sp. FACHB-68 TaxID=2692826 RepID=UPI0018EF9734|nr:prepilin-type N-terminal cleavage/methylation domain-containing protein [Microcoleus sp. FACHB-68]
MKRILKPNKLLQHLNSSSAGYTLLELLTVVIIVGVLAVLGTAGFLGWLERLRVNAAQSAALNAIHEAKNRATQQKLIWQASFQEAQINGKSYVQWAVHPDPPHGEIVPADIQWQTIEYPGVKVDTANTTLYTKQKSTGPWRVQFNYKGHTNGQLGKITLTSQNNSKVKRCVIVSTLLGYVRSAGDKRCQ